MLLEVNIEEASYASDSLILKDIHFSVAPGELVGLIGPNGAGKSTTIKSILGILQNVKGTVNVTDYSYIPERPIFYEGLTLWEHIDFLFSILGTNETRFYSKANELVHLFSLTHVVHHFPETFSKGMQQKVMLVLAFLKAPKLYIIDEPFMGLDPKAMKKLLELLNHEKERGAGILLSTHALDSAEKLCDRFILLSEGQIIVEGTLEKIREKCGLHNSSLLDCFDLLTEV